MYRLAISFFVVRPYAWTAIVPYLLVAPSALAADQVRVTVTNLAPAHGTFLTPMWVGFHDGTFDHYDQGAPASAALERLAEDGTTSPLSVLFNGSAGAGMDGTIPSGPLAPGANHSLDFMLDGSNANHRYFSYASMIIPSNDAFIANGNPLAHQVFANDGTFLGADFIVLGSRVLDAGTEVNDESPTNTAFFGQATPDTGMTQGGVVELHAGFLPVGSGGILDDAQFAAADFTAAGYEIASIQVTLVPEPASLALLALGVLLVLPMRRLDSHDLPWSM